NLPRLARQVFWQWPPRWFRCPMCLRRSSRRRSLLRGLARFEFIQPQLELLDLSLQLLRLAAELHPPQRGDQQLQLCDLRIACRQLFVFRLKLLTLQNNLLVLGEDEGSQGR